MTDSELFKNCAAVIEVLRRGVPRPDTLPGLFGTPPFKRLRWVRDEKIFCPMGLHPLSTSTAPAQTEHFAGGEYRGDDFGSFAYWWDCQTNAQAAVDAVWLPES